VIVLFLSIILAWLAVLFTVLTAVEFLIRRSGNRKLRRVFSRFHKVAGALLILTGAIHGVLAGNPSGTSLSDVTPASLLFTPNWGTLSLVAAVLLAASYIIRRILKGRWVTVHRVLTVALIACVVLHVTDVGIRLDDQIRSIGYAETVTAETLPAGGDTVVSQAVSDTAALPEAETAVLVSQANATFSGATLADGVYEGSASGFKGVITVSVTVSGGAVTDVSVIGESDTPSFFNRAEAVIDTIVEEQSLEVDAVSGATYSSAGIVNAVADALSAAVESGTLDVTAFRYSNAGHGGHGQ
jgi:uncharacterized protein with FMN-binding domain